MNQPSSSWPPPPSSRPSPSGQPSPPLPPEVALSLEVQKVLLSHKAIYVAGDPAAWPLGCVALQAPGGTVMIALWRPEQAGQIALDVQHIRKYWPAAALLLIGTESPDSPPLLAMLDACPGVVAYFDAASRQRRVRWPADGTEPLWLHPDRIDNLLDPRRQAAAAHFDPRAALVAQQQDIRQAIEFQKAVGGRKPLVSYAIMAVCVALFAAMTVSLGTTNFRAGDLVRWGGDSGVLVRLGQWWRLITGAFLHGGLVHLGFNMFAMYYIGGMLERWQGHWRTAALFLFGVLAASLTSVWWTSAIVSVGASGGLFALVGGMAAIMLRHRRDLPKLVRSSMRSWLFTLLLYNMVFLVVPSIDVAAHVGGLIGGFALGLAITRSPVGPSRLSWRAVAAVPLLLVGLAGLGHHAIMRTPRLDATAAALYLRLLDQPAPRDADRPTPATRPDRPAIQLDDPELPQRLSKLLGERLSAVATSQPASDADADTDADVNPDAAADADVNPDVDEAAPADTEPTPPGL